MILVTGYMDVDPGQRDAVIEAMRRVQSASAAEDGCQHYAFSVDLEDPNRLHVSERWESDEAMAAHAAAPHFAEFIGTLGGAIKGSAVAKWVNAEERPLF